MGKCSERHQACKTKDNNNKAMNICMLFCDLHNTFITCVPTYEILLLTPFAGWENRGSKGPRGLLRFTQVSCGAGPGMWASARELVLWAACAVSDSSLYAPALACLGSGPLDTGSLHCDLPGWQSLPHSPPHPQGLARSRCSGNV